MWRDKNRRTILCIMGFIKSDKKFIRKDSIIFHAIIFPALLMSVHEPYVLSYSINVKQENRLVEHFPSHDCWQGFTGLFRTN